MHVVERETDLFPLAVLEHDGHVSDLPDGQVAPVDAADAFVARAQVDQVASVRVDMPCAAAVHDQRDVGEGSVLGTADGPALPGGHQEAAAD